MSVTHCRPAPRRLDPLLEKRLIRAMVGVTCQEERFEFRRWLLSVNAIVQKRLFRSIFDGDARNWQIEFLMGVSAESMAMLLIDEVGNEVDDARLELEGRDLDGRERPPIW